MWRIDKIASCHQLRTMPASFPTPHPILHRHAQMARNVRIHQLQKLTSRPSFQASSFVQPSRCFSVLNRPPPKYEGHIPLTRVERLGLAIGSGLGSFLDPRRGGEMRSRDFTSACAAYTSQTSSHPLVKRLHSPTSYTSFAIACS